MFCWITLTGREFCDAVLVKAHEIQPVLDVINSYDPPASFAPFNKLLVETDEYHGWHPAWDYMQSIGPVEYYSTNTDGLCSGEPYLDFTGKNLHEPVLCHAETGTCRLCTLHMPF